MFSQLNDFVQALGFQDYETAIALPKDAIASFCTRWKIDDFYLFGSILRNDFHDNSDIDVLVTFSPDAEWGWEIVSMKEDLEKILSRKVDFLTKEAIEKSRNWIRQKEILGTERLFYSQRTDENPHLHTAETSVGNGSMTA